MNLIVRNERQMGTVLRRYRKLAGLSQSELATIMQSRQGTVSRLERRDAGHADPHADRGADGA